MVEVAKLAVVVAADTSAAERGLDAFGTKVGGAGSAIATAFGGAAIAGIAGIAAGLGTAVTSAAGFESTMSAVKAVSGATAEEMSQLSGLALQLGKDTSFSASEAGKGIEELVKGGLSIPDIMNGAAQATLNLAAAGGVSLPDAATIAANALAQFNLKGEDMAHVADLIAGAANASALDVSDFKFSLQSAGAVASTVGFSFDDLAQAIAVMGKAGITGSDAGTSLKTMMLNLQPATNAQRDLFRDLGITTFNTEKAMNAFRTLGLDPMLGTMEDAEEILKQHVTGWDGVKKMTADQEKAWIKAAGELRIYDNAFFDANGSVRSMADVAQVLQTSLEGMTDAQRLAALEVMFGSDAIRAGAVLAKEGAAGFNDMAAAMGKVSAEAVGATKLDNLAGSWEQLKGSAETLAITIGMELMPGLKGLVDSATGVVNAMIPIAERTIPRIVAAFRDEFGPIIDWFKENWPLIQQTYHTVVGGMEGDNARLATTMSTTWGGMRTIVGERIGEIGDTIKLAMQVINGDWEGAWQTMASISDREEKIRNENTRKNAEIAQGLIDTFTGGALTRFETDMRKLNDDIWTPAWATITQTVDDAWNGAAGIVKTVADAWSAVQSATDTAGRALNNVIVGIWDAIYTSVIQPKLDAILGYVDTTWTAVKTKTSELLDPWVVYIRDSILEPVRAAVEAKMNAARDLAATAWQAMSDKAKAILDPLLVWWRESFTEPLRASTESAMTGGQGVLATFTAAVDGVKSVVDTTLGGIRSTWETTWTAIQKAAESPKQALQVIIDLVSKLKSIMPEWLIPHSPTPFQVGIEGIMKAVKGLDSAFGGMGRGMDLIKQIGLVATQIGGASFAKAAMAISASETGGGSAMIERGGTGAMGPFQFDPGGELRNFARFLGVSLQQAGLVAVSQPMKAAKWALENYLGDALREGMSRGLSGAALAMYGSRVGQRPFGDNWKKAGEWYDRLFPGYASGGWAGLHGPELAWLGERGPEYVIPNHELRSGVAGGVQTVRVVLEWPDGRAAGEIVVRGLEDGQRRGRVASGVLR